jgi:hypothetical protein
LYKQTFSLSFKHSDSLEMETCGSTSLKCLR